jgi:CRISPR-associated endonuclease/helicase Cas3
MDYLAHETQLLKTHLNNVARLMRVFGRVFGAENIAYYTGLLHDFGKYTQAFQDYLRKSLKGEKVRRGEEIHAFQGAKFGLETVREPLVAEIIANAIAAHHGGLYDGVFDGKKPLYEKTGMSEDRLHYAEAKEAFLTENGSLLSTELTKLCVDEIFGICKRCKDNNLNAYFMLHLFTKALYSCLVDADRLDAAGLDMGDELNCVIPDWKEYTQRLQRSLDSPKFAVTNAIGKVRKIISEQCAEAGKREQGIYTLSVPTGGGKTLSSLRFALKHAEKHRLERIIYVIPYLSVLDQTAKNIREALACSEDADFILEHHSNMDILENEKDENEYRLLTSRWDSPIILTTMVQFLETIYSNRASRLRKFHNMTNSVIIFDEIQALPNKCIHLFNEAVNFLYIFGKSTALLCTATQPHLDKVDRPIRLSKKPSLISVPAKSLQCFKRVLIVDKTRKEGWTLDELAEFVQTKLDLGKSTLVILNTKTEAKYLYEKCKQFNCAKALLTTNLCPAHRRKVLEQVQENLEQGRLTLCISTQLIEAGVDISFECLIRAQAGLDSIVQAAGRCNRNGENPVPQEVYIVNIKDEYLSRLPEIKEGKEITSRIFSEQQGKDFLKEEALDLYYRYYFYTQKDRMDYKIKQDKETVYNLLSDNILAVETYKNQNSEQYRGLPCAFQTVARKFFVIDQEQTGIVVPYGKAEDLVKQFQAEHEPKAKAKILKQLQKYTVSVYSHTLGKLLEGKAIKMIENSFYFLYSDYYYKEQGLLLDTEVPFYI